MKIKKRIAKMVSILLSVAIVLTSTDFTVFAQGSRDAVKEEATMTVDDNPFAYALFTADMSNSLSMNADSVVINGNIHANSDFSYRGNAISINGVLKSTGQVNISVSDEQYLEKIGRISENSKTIEMNDISAEIFEEIRDDAVIHNEYASYSQATVDNDTIVYGSAGIFSSTFSGDCVFMATGDIQFGVDTLSSVDGGKVFMGSQYGNISIYASDTQMDGILYAPNGTVTITGSNVQINGRIIAKNIAFYGSNLTINASEGDLGILDCLSPDKEPDSLPDLTPDIQGPSEGRENRKIQFALQENPDSSEWNAEGITWEVYEIAGEQKKPLVKDVDYTFQASEDGNNAEMVFSKAGVYQIISNVTYNNKTFSGTSDLTITADSAPVAAIKVEECFLRDASGSVEVIIEDASYSPDGDALGSRVYRIFYDGNKDGVYQDTELIQETESLETTFVYQAEKAGDYKVVLVVRDAAASDVAAESLLKTAQTEAYFAVKDREPEITANLCVRPSYEYVLLTDSQNEQNQQFAEALEAYRNEFANADNSYSYTAQMYTSEAFTEYNGHKYQAVDTSTTWEGANAICRKMGGHMATIQSQEENDILFQYVKEQGYESAYFGLSDLDKEGVWTWSNGEEVTYTNWQNGEPNGNRQENYAMFYGPFKIGTWNDGAFNYGHTVDDVSVFICEWDEKDVLVADAVDFPEDVFTKQGSHRVIFTDIYESGQSEETIARWEAAMLATGAEIVKISNSEDITKELDKNLTENGDGNEKYYVGDELVCDYSIDTAQEELTYHYTTEYETLQGADKETAVSDTLPALQNSGKYAISVAVEGRQQQIAQISLTDALYVYERPKCSVDVKVTRKASEPGVVYAEVVTESISGENLTYEYAYKKFGDVAFTQGVLPDKLDSNAYYILTVTATDEWGVESYPGVAFISTYDEDVEMIGPTFDIALTGTVQIRPRYEYAIIGESDSAFMTSAEAVMSEYATAFEAADAAFSYELLHAWEDVKEYNGHYYWILPVKATWPNARIICENMGGHLVTISSEEENQFVLQYAKEMGRAGYVALGLHDLEKEGTWEWITGEEVTYTNWHSGEPNNGLGGTQQDYAFMYDDAKGTWDDGYVNNTVRYFMCEWERREAYESALIVELDKVFGGDGTHRTVILEQRDTLSDKTAALLEANILSTGAELYVAEDVTQVQSILDAQYEGIDTRLKEYCFVGDEIVLSGNYEELDAAAGYTWQYATKYKAFGSAEAEITYSAEVPTPDKAGSYSISVEAVYTEGEESAACELVLADELMVYERPKFSVDVTLHRSVSNQAEVSAAINTESIAGEIISYDCAYKKYGDAEFTSGSLPEQLDPDTYYLLKLTATDVHGIKSYPVVKFISTYEEDIPDVSAPEIKISFSQNPVTVNTEVSLFFAIADVSEIGEQKFYVNGGEVLPVEGIYTFTPTETGDYEIKVVATDSKGNQGTAASVLQVLEKTTAPEVSKSESEEQTISWGTLGWNEDRTAVVIEAESSKDTGLTFVCNASDDGKEIPATTARQENHYVITIPVAELETGKYIVYARVEETSENISALLFDYTEAEGDDSLSADTGVLKVEVTDVVLDSEAGIILVKGTIEATLEPVTTEIICTEVAGNTTVQVNTDSLPEGVLAEIPVAGLESGEYSIKISVSDTEGRVATAGYFFTYVKGSTPEIEVDKEDGDASFDKDAFMVQLTGAVVYIGTTVDVYVTLPSGVAAEAVRIYLNDEELAQKTTHASFTANAPGVSYIKVIVADAEGNEHIRTVKCKVLDTNDTVSPLANISYPESGSILKTPVSIIGSVSDDKALDVYRLEYKLKTESDYTVIAEGTEGVDDAVIGYFDTTLLMNGVYDVRLWAQDKGGHITACNCTYIVEGNMKIGAMSMGFTDISSQIAGMHVNVNRLYDSKNKTKGDFGYGWTLDIEGMTITESNPITDGYEMLQSGSLTSIVYEMRETCAHDVIVSYGDGTTDRFELVIYPDKSALVPITDILLSYQCVTNPKVKLEILADTQAFVTGNTVTFYDESMYEVLNYKLTDEAGIEYYLNTNDGVYKIVDNHNNEILVDDAGFHSADGKGITLERDAENRVISATDTNGNVIRYTYDEAGDLVAVKDAADRIVSFAYDDKHNIISIIDPEGIATARNEYDENGRLTAIIDAEGNRIEYTYDIEGRTQAIKDRKGNTAVYTYDENGNVIKTVDALGNISYNTYDENNNLLTTTDANGNTITYVYDVNGNIVETIAADGTKTAYGYTSNNLVSTISMLDKVLTAVEYGASSEITRSTDGNGNVTDYIYSTDKKLTGIRDKIGEYRRFTYNSDGMIISSANGAGETINYTYDADGNCNSITISRKENGETVTYTSYLVYDKVGNIVQTINSEGGVIAYEYDANNNQTASVDEMGRRIAYEYDDLGNLTFVSYPDGTNESFVYDANGNPVKVTDRSGITIGIAYDKLDRVTAISYPNGTKESYAYDAVGNITSYTNTSGATTKYTYNARNQNTAVEDAYGNITQYLYNSYGELAQITDAAGNDTKYEYDGNGNMIKVIYADGNSVSTTYDARNRIVSQTDQNGNTIAYTYDGADRLTQVTDALGNSYTYGYDENGNLTAVTDAAGNTTTYHYDSMGRVSRVTNAAGRTKEFIYDAIGNLIKATDYAGNSVDYEYDMANRLVGEITDEECVRYEYNAAGLLVSVTESAGKTVYAYDSYNRLIQKTDINGNSISYAYDTVGRISEITSAAGTSIYEYDLLDRPVRVVDHKGNATLYAYDILGNRSAVTYPNGTKTVYTYDACQRLTGEVLTDGSGRELARYSYSLGKAGERLQITEADEAGNITETDYVYDALNRLVKETIYRGDVKVINEYTYDAVSNRIGKITTLEGDVADSGMEVAAGTTTYTYNELNQLVTEQSGQGVTTYTYDNNGNLLTKSGGSNATYTYDLSGRLTHAKVEKDGIQQEEHYTYDYAGNRVSRQVNDEEVVYYVYDTSTGLSQVMAELGQAGEIKTSYTFGSDRITMEREGKVWYYHYDGHGNVRMLTDESGAVTDAYLYDAYGNLLVHKGDTANDFLYCGEQYNAATDLYYLRARYMDPATGTFISMDSYQGSIYDPVSLHKYLYANANPVTYIDPTGYTPISEWATNTTIIAILAGVVTIMYVPVLLNIECSMSTTPSDWREHIETFPATRESKQSILVTPKIIIEDDLFEVFPATTKELEDYWLPLVPPMIVADMLLDIFLVPEAKRMLIEYIEGGTKWKRMTAKESAEAAKKLGFEKTNVRAKNNEPIYYNRKTKTYISQDIGSGDGSGPHNGGVWKQAKTPGKLNSKGTRMGTYDSNLNRIGD